MSTILLWIGALSLVGAFPILGMSETDGRGHLEKYGYLAGYMGTACLLLGALSKATS